jgi:hypothetical protein
MKRRSQTVAKVVDMATEGSDAQKHEQLPSEVATPQPALSQLMQRVKAAQEINLSASPPGPKAGLRALYDLPGDRCRLKRP